MGIVSWIRKLPHVASYRNRAEWNTNMTVGQPVPLHQLSFTRSPGHARTQSSTKNNQLLLPPLTTKSSLPSHTKKGLSRTPPAKSSGSTFPNNHALSPHQVSQLATARRIPIDPELSRSSPPVALKLKNEQSRPRRIRQETPVVHKHWADGLAYANAPHPSELAVPVFH